MNIFTRKSQLSLYALVACTVSISAFATNSNMSAVEAHNAIVGFDQKTLADYFPIETKQSSKSKSLDIDPGEKANFEAAMEKHALAIQKLNPNFTLEEFKGCWKEEELKYLNPATIRNISTLSTGDIIGKIWPYCVFKNPGTTNMNVSAEAKTHLIDKATLGTIAGGAGAAVLYILNKVASIAEQTFTSSILADLMRAYAEPVMGPIRGATGVRGARDLKKWSTKLQNYLSDHINDQEEKLDQLDYSQKLIKEAKELSIKSIIPGLSKDELDENFKQLNHLFNQAVSVWNSTLPPASQSGRSTFNNGVLLAPRDDIGSIAAFDGTYESALIAMHGELPRAAAKQDEAIAARRRLADDQIQLVQASNSSDKTSAVQKILDERDADIKVLEEEKGKIKESLDKLLSAAELRRQLRHDMPQDSNIIFRRAEKILEDNKVPYDVSASLMTELKDLLENEVKQNKVSDALLSMAHDKLSHLSAPTDVLDDLLKEEKKNRAAALEQIQAQDSIIAEESKNLAALHVDATFLDDILLRQSKMLETRQQLVAAIASQELHDQMFPEYSRLASPEITHATEAMKKEYGLQHYREKFPKQVERLLQEMGFDLTEDGKPNVNRIGELNKAAEGIERDQAVLITDINQKTAAGIRDRLKYLLGLPSKLGEQLGKCPSYFGILNLFKKK